jgi:hypothetical protein
MTRKKFRDASGVVGAYTAEYHQLFQRSPWVLLKHVPVQLTEGDIATVFSQFGEVSNVLFVRHHSRGDFLGTAYVEFIDTRSAALAADNMNSGPGLNGVPGKQVHIVPQPAVESGERDGAIAERRGLFVDRCEAHEVPQRAQGASTYAAWYVRTMLGRV